MRAVSVLLCLALATMAALTVAITIVWCAIVSAILYKIVDVIVGLRVPVEAEREGLDLATHGEAAYHS